MAHLAREYSMRYLTRFFKDLSKYSTYVVCSAKAKLAADVAGSRLNWVWWVLEPLCMMLVYTFVFGVIFTGREENFPLFIFIGLTLWNFFSGNVKVSVRIIRRSKSVITRIYVPKLMLNITQLLVSGFKMLISFGIIIIMMIFFRVVPTVNILWLIPVMLLLVMLSFGVMCFFMHFGVYVTDLVNATDIILKLIFYMTGIFFDITLRVGKSYPELAVVLSKVNPMAFILTSARTALLGGGMPDLLCLGIWFVIALLIDIFGIILVYKNENSYAKAI